MKVLLFASLGDLVGHEEVVLEIEREMTVAECVALLEAQYPALLDFQGRFRVAVNQVFSQDDDLVSPDDELALIPPVSGGSGSTYRAALRHEALDVQGLTEEVRRDDCGAVVCFLGTVRELTGELVTDKLCYSAYQEMAEKEMVQICQQALTRFELRAVVLEHRLGELLPGEVAVVAACSAPHRDQAFLGARFLIDSAKENVPIWKKEFGPEGEFWPEPSEKAKV